MSALRLLDVYGTLSDLEARAVRGAAAALGLEVATFESPVALAQDLERRVPVAVLVAWGCDGAVEVLAHLRGRVQYAALPILALSDERRDAVFGEVYAQGGDDVAGARSIRALVARLRPLVDRTQVAPAASPRGSAVVAGTDASWRTMVGRMLSNAGLQPLYVNNAQDAISGACAAGTRFVVARDDLPPNGAAEAVAQAGRLAPSVPWIVLAPSRRAAPLLAANGEARVAVVDVLAPPDHLLFLANDLGRSQLAERRSSPRLLCASSVAFRPAGEAEDDVGFTYNVSAGGIFVRTLAPPPAGCEVWLELVAPASDRVVRLVGQVAWRRAFGPNESATVPPGFGVGLRGGLPGDLERWVDGCKALAERPGANGRRAAWDRLSELPPSLAASTIL